MNIVKNMIRIIYTYNAAIWVELGAIALLIIGNNSRPYAAFGGEEMGFIALTIFAIIKIKAERERRYQWKRRELRKQRPLKEFVRDAARS